MNRGKRPARGRWPGTRRAISGPAGLGTDCNRAYRRNRPELPCGTRCPASISASRSWRSARSTPCMRKSSHLYEKIIPDHRTQRRQTRQDRAAFLRLAVSVGQQ